MTMKLGKYMIAAVALLMSTACNGRKAVPDTATDNSQMETSIDTTKKALVVFFSHAGENYSVGNIQVGNTKIVADYISEMTNADQFEIKTSKYDGMAYKPLCDLAKKEQEDGELPPFEGSVDVTPYETIFIGGPVWWGTYPQVMFTFFKEYDLNGKTIIPFTTHEGSGLGNCVDDVRKAYPQATVTEGFSMYGHDVRSGKARVEKWLKGLGYAKKAEK